MRSEIVALHRRLRITTVYVTHDQVEAMTMATHIAVMFEGRLHQAGSPAAVFDDPSDLRVARFIGAPRMNIVPGKILRAGNDVFLGCLGTHLALGAGLTTATANETPVQVGFRPSDLSFKPPIAGAAGFAGVVEFLEPMGSETFVTLRCGSEAIVARAPGRAPLTIGETVTLYPDCDFLYAFDSTGGQSLINRSRLGQTASAARRMPV
jgi:ABC-type sugar transport system ATPase subunit